MACPRPQPTALKAARGNPGKRALNKNEPQPSREFPPCPEWLTEAAKAEWAALVPELSRIGIITGIDANSFIRYCINLAEWRACVDFLAANGPDLVARDIQGNVTGVVPYPHTKRKREYEVLLL